MKREQLSTIICNIDDRHIAEAYQFDPDLCARSSERIVHMSKKRIITFALAAALMLALGAVAYAATNWFVEWRSLKNDPALQQQADIGADDLHQFAGGQFVADDDVLYEDGDQGQSDTTMYFFNDHTYSVDYYGSGEIHSLDARESFALEDHDGMFAVEYWEKKYPNAEEYKARIETATPGILDKLHSDGWIIGESSGIERAYCKPQMRFMDDCAVVSVLMTDGTAYELWLQPDTFEPEGFMFFKAEDTPNTRNGFFTALHEGTEDEWWEMIQNSGVG